MKKNLILEDQIARIKKLSGIDEVAGSTSWVQALLTKITQAGLADDVISEFEPLITSGKIGINKTAKTITLIDWNKMTDDEIKLLFRSDELVKVMDDFIKAKGLKTNAGAMRGYTGNMKRIMDGYVAGKAQPRITSNSTSTNTGNLNLGNLSSNIVDRDDFMKYVEASPKFSAVLKAKGNKDQLKNWIELNLPEKLDKSEIINKINPFIQDLIDSPDVVKVAFGKKLNSIFDFIKKGKEFPDLLKGAFGWSLLAMIGLIAIGAITPADAFRFYLCPLIPKGKLYDFAGCSSTSGSSGSSGGSGTADIKDF